MADEKRLIDANELLEDIEGTAWYTIHCDGRATQGASTEETAWYKATDIYSAIENAKDVDAVEVVHGRWKYDSYNMRYYCTECDEEPLKYTKTFLDGSTLTEEFLTDYCPNCGAFMRDGDGNA